MIVNNPRVGVVSGTDEPLPPNCAIATCHHREHQLRGGGWCAPTDCQTGVCTAAMKHEPTCPKPGWGYDSPPWDGTVLDLPTAAARGGWCAPSPYMQHLLNGRTHVGVMTTVRRWWQVWKPKSVSWEEDVPCFDSECGETHKTSPVAETMLELPAVSVRRGGIRFAAGKGGTA